MSDVATGAATSPSSARMLTTLVRLRDALQRAALPLEIPGVERAPRRPGRDDRPARGLRPAAAGADRRPAAHRGRRLDRRRQVHAGELAGRHPRHRARRAPADDAVAGARAPPRRRGLVRPGPDPARPRAHRRARPTDPGALQLVASTAVPPGPGHARRARHRLGRGAQPDAGRPAARRGRPVAVRHLGRAVRRPGALGLPQAGRRPQCRGRDRARPHPRRPPWPRSAATWPGC